MRKKAVSIILAFATLAMSMGSFCPYSYAAIADPTASSVYVNGRKVAFDAYNINDSNYFKLRDIAFALTYMALDVSGKHFEVEWDGENNAISLTSGQLYTSVGGELAGKKSGAAEAAPTDSKIYLDGREAKFTAYNIDGNNFLNCAT